MHVTAEARFDADPERVAQMLADEDFVRDKLEKSGAISHTVGVVKDASGGFTVTTRRQVPTDSIPAQFRSIVGASLEVRQVEAWEPATGNGRLGTVLVEVTGAPVRMTGTVELKATDTGTLAVVDGELKAAIPLFGAAVEKATAQAISATMAAEQSAGAAWLARMS